MTSFVWITPSITRSSYHEVDVILLDTGGLHMLLSDHSKLFSPGVLEDKQNRSRLPCNPQ